MEAIKFFQSFSSDFLNSFMIFITSFGSMYFSVFLVCIVYWCYNKEIGYKLAVILSCSSVLNNIVKGLVQAERPIGSEGIFSIAEFSATGYSFPSGHAQNITTLGTSLSLFTRNKIVFILSCVLVVLVSISRIYLGLHWPMDIFGGIILALIVSVTLNEVLVKFNKININILVGVLILVFMLGFTFISNNDMGQDYFKSMQVLSGIYLGHLFERRYVNFSPYASNIDNVVKVVIGVFSTVFIYFLLTYISRGIWFISMVKYIIIGFWIIGIVPFIFKLSNLYYKEAYEITNIRY